MIDPWDQRLDERDLDYRQFLWWRDQTPRPPPSDLALAARYEWSARAAAWDLRRSVPATLDGQLDAGVGALCELFVLQARRALDRTRTDPSYEIPPRELAALAKGLVAIKLAILEARTRLVGEDSSPAEEIDDLTLEEQKVLLRLLERSDR
jgi:hypothetical protein